MIVYWLKFELIQHSLFVYLAVCVCVFYGLRWVVLNHHYTKGLSFYFIFLNSPVRSTTTPTRHIKLCLMLSLDNDCLHQSPDHHNQAAFSFGSSVSAYRTNYTFPYFELCRFRAKANWFLSLAFFFYFGKSKLPQQQTAVKSPFHSSRTHIDLRWSLSGEGERWTNGYIICFITPSLCSTMFRRGVGLWFFRYSFAPALQWMIETPKPSSARRSSHHDHQRVRGEPQHRTTALVRNELDWTFRQSCHLTARFSLVRLSWSWSWSSCAQNNQQQWKWHAFESVLWQYGFSRFKTVSPTKAWER